MTDPISVLDGFIADVSSGRTRERRQALPTPPAPEPAPARRQPKVKPAATTVIPVNGSDTHPDGNYWRCSKVGCSESGGPYKTPAAAKSAGSRHANRCTV